MTRDPRHPYPFSDMRKMQEGGFEEYQLLVSLEIRLQIGYPDIRISGYPARRRISMKTSDKYPSTLPTRVLRMHA